MNKIILKTKPIGINRLYRGRKFLTKDGKAIKESMAWEAKSQWKGEPTEAEVSVNILFYFKNRHSLDIDGAIKGLLDCLTGVVWKDDRQVVELHAFKLYDAKDPRVELTII